MSSKKSSNTLLVVSVILFIIALVAFFTASSYYGAYTGKKLWWTGFATTSNDTAIVNITISETLAINFTTDIIDWGTGAVTAGKSYATLVTVGAGGVTDGTWKPVNHTHALQLENIGNINASIYLQAGHTAANFLGGTSPSFQYNITNNETGSCVNLGGAAGAANITLGLWYDVNASIGATATSYGTKICETLFATETKDNIYIDVKLVVPSDSNIGTLTSNFTATAVKTSLGPY